jgi:cytochrome c556
MKRIHLAAAAAAILVTAAAAAQRVAAPPAQTIQTRQHNYKQMAAALKAVGDELRGSSPSLAAIRRHSATLESYARQVLRWFPPGTGAEAGVRTRALPAIWSDRPGFERAGARLLVATRGLNAAARRGDLDRIRAALPAVRSACSGCHDDFRAPE